jgi:hypothetical protein
VIRKQRPAKSLLLAYGVKRFYNLGKVPRECANGVLFETEEKEVNYGGGERKFNNE